MHLKHKIVIKKRNYNRPKRLFYHDQKVRHVFPYLHKKDDVIHVIAPEEAEVNTIQQPEQQSSQQFNQQPAKQQNDVETAKTEHDQINAVTETSQHTEPDIEQDIKQRVDQPVEQAIHTTESAHDHYDAQRTQQEEFNETAFIKPTKDSTHQTDRLRHRNQSSWLAHLPKILMGMLVGILLGILLMSLFNGKQQKQQADKVTQTVEQSVKQNMKNIVSVTNLQKTEGNTIDTAQAAKSPEEVGIGTGVIYKLDGSKAYILTNYHVVGKAPDIEVSYGDEKVKAKMLGYDVWTDLAILTIPKGKLNSVITMADSSKLQPGQPVIAMGSPLGKMFAGSVSSGIISGLSRNVPVDIDGDQVYDWEMHVLQTDAAINPGNSGGPLLNQQGQMVGLNSLKISMNGVEGIAFSIPTNDVKSVLNELEQKGSIKRPKIGVMVENIGKLTNPNDPNSPTDQQGVQITQMEPNGTAQKSGLQVGDVIKKIDNKNVESKIHFRKILFFDKKVGDTIIMTIVRNGSEKQIEVKL
ncbi:S1C family serine protease [Macrococcus capreoli]|uniref:S1C family serine protease n=1 Tax=Macrococcus capreoli TaxID=2982690 RepID=UPI003F43E52B